MLKSHYFCCHSAAHISISWESGKHCAVLRTICCWFQQLCLTFSLPLRNHFAPPDWRTWPQRCSRWGQAVTPPAVQLVLCAHTPISCCCALDRWKAHERWPRSSKVAGEPLQLMPYQWRILLHPVNVERVVMWWSQLSGCATVWGQIKDVKCQSETMLTRYLTVIFIWLLCPLKVKYTQIYILSVGFKIHCFHDSF